jgi:tetratricopeptide (TPR) repeat protein
MKANFIVKIMMFIFIILLLIGLFSPFIASYLNNSMGTNIDINSFESNYLLTVISATAAIAGVFFVIYAWYTIKELPDTIDKIVSKNVDEKIKVYNEKLEYILEANHKMNAVYSIKNPDKKIDLLNEVINLYPNTYNARITLGYTYWYDKNDLEKAEQCFESELADNPMNVNAMCDLVALYDAMGESYNALKYAKKAIGTDEKTKDYLMEDSRLKDELKQEIQKLTY